jgi:hypothetical protein
VVRSSATFAGSLGAVVALTWVGLMVRAVDAIGGACSWVADGVDELTPPCPDGMATIGLTALVGGALALTGYVKAGLRVGPRLAILAWPALFGPMFWAVLDGRLHPDGPGGSTDYGVLWAVPEAALFVLLPLFVLPFHRGAWRQVLWSDGRGVLADDGARPVPTVAAGLRPWSAALQAVAIVCGVCLGIASFHAVVRPDEIPRSTAADYPCARTCSTPGTVRASTSTMVRSASSV